MRAVHEKGIVHFDLRQANILQIQVANGRQPLIIDWGYAQKPEGINVRTSTFNYLSFRGAVSHLPHDYADLSPAVVDMTILVRVCFIEAPTIRATNQDRPNESHQDLKEQFARISTLLARDQASSYQTFWDLVAQTSVWNRGLESRSLSWKMADDYARQLKYDELGLALSKLLFDA